MRVSSVNAKPGQTNMLRSVRRTSVSGMVTSRRRVGLPSDTSRTLALGLLPGALISRLASAGLRASGHSCLVSELRSARDGVKGWPDSLNGKRASSC